MKLRVPINQRGVALGIVVWFIAGMSLLVSGIIAEARVDTRLAQLHYAKAKAAAAGDGAIHLALAEQVARKQNKQKGADRRRELQIGGNIVAIRMIPSGLLVNISTEAVKGLTSLFSMAQSRSQGDTRRWRLSPEQLARAVVAYRDGVNGRRGSQFFSLEDLLRVPGVDREVFDAVRDFIVTENLAGNISGAAKNTGSSLRNLESAMSGEGAMLDGNVQLAADQLRVDAIVRIGDQEWLRRRWVSFQGDNSGGLPWDILRSEAARPLGQRQPI